MTEPSPLPSGLPAPGSFDPRAVPAPALPPQRSTGRGRPHPARRARQAATGLSVAAFAVLGGALAVGARDTTPATPSTATEPASPDTEAGTDGEVGTDTTPAGTAPATDGWGATPRSSERQWDSGPAVPSTGSTASTQSNGS